MPDVLNAISCSFYLMKRMLGVKSSKSDPDIDKVDKLKEGELLMINVGS